MGSSNLITNKQLINDAVRVYTFASDIAVKSGHIGSDLLLTAVWYCVNHDKNNTFVAEPPPKSKAQNVSSNSMICATLPNNISTNSKTVAPSSIAKTGNRASTVSTVTKPSKPSADTFNKSKSQVTAKANRFQPKSNTAAQKQPVNNDDDIEIIELDDDDDEEEDNVSSQPATKSETSNVTANVNKKGRKEHLFIGVSVDNKSGETVVSEKENVDLFEMDCEEIDPYEELKNDAIFFDGKNKTVEEVETSTDNARNIEEKENDEDESDEEDPVTIISDFEDSDNETKKKNKKNNDTPFKCKTPKNDNITDIPRVSTRSNSRKRSKCGGNKEDPDAVPTTTDDNSAPLDNDGPVADQSASNKTEGIYSQVETGDRSVFGDSPMITNVQSLSQSEQSDFSDTNLFINDNESGSGVTAVTPVPVTAYSSRVNKPLDTITSIAASQSNPEENNTGYQPVYSGQPGLYMTADMSRGQDSQSMSNSVMAGYSVPNPENPVVFSRAYNPSQPAPHQSMVPGVQGAEQSPLIGLHQLTDAQQVARAQHVLGNHQLGGDQQIHRPHYMGQPHQMPGLQPMAGTQQMSGLAGAPCVPGAQHVEGSQQMQQMTGHNLPPGHEYSGIGIRQPAFSMSSMMPPCNQQSHIGTQPGHMMPPGTEQPQMYAPRMEQQQQQQQQQQHSLFQQQFIQQFVQPQQQPTEDESPPMKRRLLDHDRKWHSGPKFSHGQEKYVGATQNEYDPRKSATPNTSWGESTTFDGGMRSLMPLVSMEMVDDDRQVPVIYAGHVQPLVQEVGHGEPTSSQPEDHVAEGNRAPRGRGQRSRGRRKVRGRHTNAIIEKSPTRSENDVAPAHTTGHVSRGRGYRGGGGPPKIGGGFSVHKGPGVAGSQRGRGASRPGVENVKVAPQGAAVSGASPSRGRRRKRGRRGR